MSNENVYELPSNVEPFYINAQSGHIRPSDIENILPSNSDYIRPDGVENNNVKVEPESASNANPAFEHFDNPINTQQPRARMSVPQTQDKPADVPLCRQPMSCGPVVTVILFASVALGLVILGVNVHLQLESLITELKTTQGELKQTENDLNELKAKQDDQVKTNVEVQNCMSRRVGFMSVISSTFNGGHVATFAANQPIVFDKVMYSSGGGYDNQTGLFTCSVPGEYHFSVHSVSAPSQDIILELRLNSVVITTIYAFDVNTVESGTEGAVLHLNKNDVVSVVSAPFGTSEFYQDVNVVQSNVFTGHLIHSDDCLV